jgi:isopentenyl-diphosphate delta-isomerase
MEPSSFDCTLLRPARQADFPMRLVETVSPAGEVGPSIAILDAHRTATAHRAISIVAWNPGRTRMLVTRRAASKLTWPGFWSNAVCSHPLPQEAYGAAARRRLAEELRIHAPLRPAFQLYYGPVRCPVSGVYEHELDQVFHAILREDAPIDPDPREISEARWLGPDDVAALDAEDRMTPWFRMILKRVRWGG